MTLWLAVLLGLVQGVTEFLPISSTAHLRITPTLLGQPDPGAAFDAVIQLGTLAAVIVYFAKDLYAMGRAVLTDRRSPDARLAFLVVLGTIPVGIAGLAFKKHIKGDLRSLYVIAAALTLVAILMVVVERGAKFLRTTLDLTPRDALLIGCAQACALVPGVSRSGATLTAALLLGMTRPDAARFSFLLSIPAIGAAGVFQLKDALHDFHGASPAPLVIATLVSAAAGYASIAWLMRYLRTKSLAPFAMYRIALAVALVVLCIAGVVSPSS
jgi:undecaprenyl-diphosphatase